MFSIPSLVAPRPLSSTPAVAPVAVVLIDDHEGFRRAIREFIEQDRLFRVFAEASSVATGLLLPATPAPDLILLDWRLTDGSGLELISPFLARWLAVKILMLTLENSPAHKLRSLRMGAHGFVCKDDAEAGLLPAMRAAISP